MTYTILVKHWAFCKNVTDGKGPVTCTFAYLNNMRIHRGLSHHSLLCIHRIREKLKMPTFCAVYFLWPKVKAEDSWNDATDSF
jgi:hypothetical protein